MTEEGQDFGGRSAEEQGRHGEVLAQESTAAAVAAVAAVAAEGGPRGWHMHRRSHTAVGAEDEVEDEAQTLVEEQVFVAAAEAAAHLRNQWMLVRR